MTAIQLCHDGQPMRALAERVEFESHAGTLGGQLVPPVRDIGFGRIQHRREIVRGHSRGMVEPEQGPDPGAPKLGTLVRLRAVGHSQGAEDLHSDAAVRSDRYPGQEKARALTGRS
jgi:hypothetical protein